MPKCIFKSLTGYDCPSCGATRATYALIHGNIIKAISYNYFLVIGVAYAALVSVVLLVPSLHRSKLRKIIFGRTAAFIYITLFFVWWIVRNLTWYKELI